MHSMRRFYRSIDRWLIIVILGLLAQTLLYFATGKLQTPAVTVWCPWDESIPFIPAFIVFYIGWFAYIPATILAQWHFHRKGGDYHKEFVKNMIMLGAGLLIGTLTFVIFPTQIPEGFRGELPEQGNIFERLTALIYSADGRRNAFPSEHCIVAITLCIGIQRAPILKKSRHRLWVYPLNLIAAIGICASTVCVKQHSILDVFGAIAVMIVTYTLVYLIPWKKPNRK